MLLVFLSTLFGDLRPHTVDVGFKATIDSFNIFNPHLSVQVSCDPVLSIYDPVLTIQVPPCTGTYTYTDTVYNSMSVEYNSGTQVYGGYSGLTDNPPDSFTIAEFRPSICNVGNN